MTNFDLSAGSSSATGRRRPCSYSDFGIELTSLHKKPKVQYELSGLRTYQFGVGGAVSYSGVGVFVRYGVTPLFKKGGGPECHTLSFGISLLM